MKKKTVSVYGYGRFGKFWADLLKNDFMVKVYSRRGLSPADVSQGITIARDYHDLFDCHALFFCVSISAFENVLINSKQYFKDGTIFFDTCSVKVEPAKWMMAQLPEESEIIATHPMFGPDSFYESPGRLPMVMSNLTANDTTFAEWVEYFSSKKMQVEKMTPEQHDEAVAYSQGITHFVGRVLSDLELSPSRIDTLGYQKLMEIIAQTCNDNWQLFIDLQKFNPYTKKMREDLQKSLDKIYCYLEDCDGKKSKSNS